MKKHAKKLVALVLAVCLLVSVIATLAACNKNGGPNDFTWFITKDDSDGQRYYKNYNESFVVQYLNMLSWDTENGGHTTDESGEKINLSFQTARVDPSEELNIMFAGGKTTDLIDLASVNDSPKQLVKEGTLMEITDYVERYMPNYLAFLKENPDIEKFVLEKDETGKKHYYALYQVADEANDNFQGFMYRRDWIVKYGEAPTHVWADNVITGRDSVSGEITDYTKVDTTKIHYTSYLEAKAHNDWTGWVENPNYPANGKFTSSDGADPDATYTDNVVFPSGGVDPHYISDWEWMLEIFKGHLGSALTNSDIDQYALSIYQWGFNGAGDFWSSFGGGHPAWYVDPDGTVHSGSDSTTMKAYLDCMHEWYTRGYVDTKFDERNTDFWKINENAFITGKIAMGQYGMARPGSSIRNMQGDTEGAMLWGCCLPINDMYGEAENKFVTPDACYSATRVSTINATGIAMTARNKNLPALFTMLDYMYSEEGAVLLTFGLNGEQYQQLKSNGITGEDYYEKYGLTNGTYTVEQVEENGETYNMYKRIQVISDDSLLQGAANGQRMLTTMQINGKIVSTYKRALRHAMDEWRRYYNSTDITNYVTFLDLDESRTYTSVYNSITTHVSQAVPNLIRNGYTKDTWEDYLYQLQVIIGVDDVTEILQKVVDKIG